MFPTASLTAFNFLLLAVGIAADPIVIRQAPVSLPFARHLNATGSNDLVRKDQARAKNLVAVCEAKESGALGPDAIVSVGVTNIGVIYQANVGVGNPATSYTLLIDTGSSNTWVGAGKPYIKTKTSVQTPNNVSVTYGSGSFSGDFPTSPPSLIYLHTLLGTEFTDTVTVAPSLVIPRQSIGVASNSTGFEGFDGILGIGPSDLTIGTLSPAVNTSIPTVTDNLFSQGAIASDLVSVSFEPTTTSSIKNGELTFGGTDPTKFTGKITFIPLTTTHPSSEFWGIDQSIRYGASTTILTTTAGVVDTGTTFILIATDAFNRYCTATGAVLDPATGLLRITPAQFANLEPLFFTTGDRTFELTPNAQIWPRALNAFIGGTTDSIYLVVNDIGTPTGAGLDFINGYTFLERFYSVFDTGKHRIGLATTPFTKATCN
ncbi:aspartic peptidase A1 [Lactifluus subvellereus]|nr:aspartic peptidase A1 [Lactifluus subvellereus]